MKAKGWSNGGPNNETGAGYGIRLTHADRDRYFDPTWVAVELQLGADAEVTVPISPSFWRGCAP